MVRIIPMASTTLRPASFRQSSSSLSTSTRMMFSLTSSSSQLLNPSTRISFLHQGGKDTKQTMMESANNDRTLVRCHCVGTSSSSIRRSIIVSLLKWLVSLELVSAIMPTTTLLFGLKQGSRLPISAGNMAQASTSASSEDALEWVKKDNRRMLHVVYRVGDLDRTIKFYTECLGMKLLRKRDIPEERYTNAFLGYGPEDSHFVIELTYNYGVDSYDIGAGFGHFGIAVEDVAKTVELVKAKGGKVTREPGPVKGGSTVIAFIEDPDGYKFELLERGPTPEPLCQVMLRVGDLDRSIEFYKKAYGMELLRTRDNPQYKYTIAMLGYGPEDKSAVMELTYNYGVKEYEKGNAYAQMAIGTDDVYKTAEAIKLCGGKITREPGPLPGINTKITACLDPDGWKTVFVDNIDLLKELE